MFSDVVKDKEENMGWEKLTDLQWEKVKQVLPRRKVPRNKKDRKGGRNPVDDRRCFEGILWILWTGSPWVALPRIYGAKSTVHRRLKKWTEGKVFEKLWKTFLAALEDKGQLRWNECFVDGTFASAKKGALASEKLNAGKERS